MQPTPGKQKLTQADLDRLSKLCGLFSSDHAGERANAAALGDQFLRARGLRWPDIIGVPTSSIEPTSYDDDLLNRWPGQWRGAALFCARHDEFLTPWEASFAERIAGWRGAVSDKQLDILRRLLDRVLKASTTP